MGVSLGAIYANPVVSRLVKANFISLRKLPYLFFQLITCKFCKSKGIFCISQPNPRQYNIGTRISQSAQSRCDSVPETSRQLMAVFRWRRLLTYIKMNIYKKVTVIKLQLQLQIFLIKILAGLPRARAPYSWNMVTLFSFGCHVIDRTYVSTRLQIVRAG